MEKKFKFPESDYEVIYGKFAQQADGAIWFQQGGTVILSTVVSAPSAEFPGFLPLTTDYREQYAAAGKIPGGYFKREGKSSDKEVLVSRLIDRAIRPLFPENYFNQVQALSTVYSYDKKHLPYALALIATSLALVTSKIPFLGPIGAAEVGKIDGKWVVNPIYEESLKSDVKITVAGTKEGITMVEGSSSEISDSDFIDAMFLAHETIKKQIEWQESIVAEINPKKEVIEDEFDWDLWKQRSRDFLTEDKLSSLFVANKVERSAAMSNLQEEFLNSFKEEIEKLDISNKYLYYIFDQVLKIKLTDKILTSKKRIDGRDFDQVRKISTQVGLLPFTHGSALFTRGGTQALVSVTLGGGEDEQKVEDIVQDSYGRAFMLNYNFPPFSVGEARPLRGPGRREVGHGHLAASSFKYVLPDPNKFPYTIRIVADMLASDGSTSMATVCGSTMALMDAGVPISSMVGGVAMGLLRDGNNEFQVLTDISGFEDAFGLMDLKVAGTKNGITAAQMDIKYKGGLPRKIFEMAFKRAREGYLHILGEMEKVMTAPKEHLSSLVPKITTMKIDKDKIGAVIGKGGQVIREISDKTDTKIEIEDDGTVKIFGHEGPNLDKAISWIKALAGQIERFAKYEGQIKKVADFGIFVEIAPGQDGLVHISQIPKNLQSTLKVGDCVKVEVIDYDESTGRVRLKLTE